MPLSHGLPALTVAGNRVVNRETLEPVLLRGLNRSGFEYSAETQIGEVELDAITQDWNANVIRLPFNQDWALERDGYDPTRYREALARVVAMAARRGAYTMLDLQWLDACTPRGTVNGKPNYVAPLPNVESITIWKQLARLWKAEPAILYDIFNEPHDPLTDDCEPIAAIADDLSAHVLRRRKVRAAEWHPWARHLVSAIRSENEHALIFVSGLDWGYNLNDCPIAGLSDVVYSTHVYPWKGRDWDRAFGSLSSSVPVFAAEWGGGDEDLEWGETLAHYFDECGIGWTAWSWSDEPRLIACPVEPPYAATKFGSLVRGRLRSLPNARD